MNNQKQFDPELSFTISVNEKGENANRPDYRGQITVSGVKYWLSGWLKSGKNGDFISGKAQIAEEKPKSGAAKAETRGFPRPAQAKEAATQANPQPKRNDDEDVPF